jgi:hypothetical protein
MDYLILRTGHFDDSYVDHVIFFTSISEKTLKISAELMNVPIPKMNCLKEITVLFAEKAGRKGSSWT